MTVALSALPNIDLNERRNTVEHELNRPQLTDGENIFYNVIVKMTSYVRLDIYNIWRHNIYCGTYIEWHYIYIPQAVNVIIK